MRLEFEQQIIPQDLQQELDFSTYLARFDCELPLLPHLILRPFTKDEGEAHFARLRGLETQLERDALDISSLIAHGRQLPRLDHLLAAFEDASLEQFHLHSLGNFMARELRLQQLEEALPITGEPSPCLDIKRVLDRATQNNYAGLRFAPHEEELRRQISGLEQELQQAISRHEQEIHAQTGLRMIYPYPLELARNAEIPAAITDCPRLKLCSGLAEHRLSPAVAASIEHKERLNQELSTQMEAQLRQLNAELAPFAAAFGRYYQQRKERLFDYALLSAKQHHGLCFPDFRAEPGCRLQQAVLPCLAAQNPRYVPLDLDLQRGANLLFGANMTGKTTILKTLYFHLCLVRMGLPLPAAAAQLHFPAQLEVSLKSSGSLKTGLSGFGEELQFFTRELAAGAYLLIDELFQATDPLNGSALSRIILEEFRARECVFFCTTHYPEVLQVPGIKLLRMQDRPLDQARPQSLSDLLVDMPYTLEKIPPEARESTLANSRQPLQIALCFALPESIKQKIRLRIAPGSEPEPLPDLPEPIEKIGFYPKP